MKSFCFFILLFQTCFFSNSYSQDIILYKGKNLIIGENISIFEDAKNSLPFDSVIKQAEKFQKIPNKIPNLPLSNSSFWLKFSIKNLTESEFLLLNIEFPILDVCEFYAQKNGVYSVEKLGDKVHFEKRKYQHQNFLFDIQLPKDSTQTYYLRIKSSEQMVLPIIIGTPQKIAESLLSKDLLWGIFVGIILVMVLYNFFVFVSTKDKSYLHYVLYIAFIGLTQITLSGYTYRFIFQNNPNFLYFTIIAFPVIAGVSGILFIRNFLHTKDSTPILNKLLTLSIIFYTVAIVLRVFNYSIASYRAIDISALTSTITTYIIAITIARKGYRPAKFFLIAWTIFLIGLILFVLKNLGILPYNYLTNYTIQIGIAIEVTLLSFALADKLNILKKEKALSQLAALKSAQENERLIKEQNVFLEEKVKERTEALSKTNENLSETLENLKQAQSQLVESEKMASLGQLTAGIAHEINNPINFVTSNVNPLKRDVGMLFEAIDFIEQKVFEITPVNEKRAQIEEYKEELDFDYLKEEIEHLLNGIQEGSSRTAEIVKGLRIFSRIDEYDLKKANINEGLDSTLIIINNLLNGTIKISKEYDVDLPTIECYPGKLNQVFLNMFNNSIHAIRAKYGDKANGIITIKTKTIESGIKIVIADNGIGMDEATKHKIYEPFFTTKEVGVGTGLGMSIVYNTIKKHEGKIELNSIPGEGTTFEIYLPFTSKIL